MGKVREQRTKGMNVILRSILPDWQTRQRVGRKRALIIMQYWQGGKSLLIFCLWWRAVAAPSTKIEGAPPSWFTFASRLCGVEEWTGPSGNFLSFCDLNNQQWLGGTGNSSSDRQLFCEFYRVRNFSPFLCINFFFNLRLWGVQTGKEKSNKQTNKNFLYHFEQEKQKTKPDPKPLSMAALSPLSADPVSEPSPGDRTNYVTSASLA